MFLHAMMHFLTAPVSGFHKGLTFQVQKIGKSFYQKSPSLNFVQGQAVIYLRYHLVWCQAPTLYRMQLHSWSRNADPEVLQRRVMEQAEWKILPKAIDMIANHEI